MQRAQRINALNWDETAGVYFVYNFEQKVRRNYVFGTMFMPMWAGIASKEQAARLVANLPLWKPSAACKQATTSAATNGMHPTAGCPCSCSPCKACAATATRKRLTTSASTSSRSC